MLCEYNRVKQTNVSIVFRNRNIRHDKNYPETSGWVKLIKTITLILIPTQTHFCDGRSLLLFRGYDSTIMNDDHHRGRTEFHMVTHTERNDVVF